MAWVMQSNEVPSKNSAVDESIRLGSLPSHHYVFINALNPGHEDILKAVACLFGSEVCRAIHLVGPSFISYLPRIHLDRYRYMPTMHLRSDHLLALFAILDSESARFHVFGRLDW
ncbi:hypothetical protein PM082_015071 [Marasmius tenuissimus]|nr:hypothetical protein PM082_015071 [Marasmius tenuissimus]